MKLSRCRSFVPLFLLSALCSLSTGCVVSGEKTAIGRLQVEGRMVDEQGQPMPGQEIMLLRPYGQRAIKDELDSALDRLERQRAMSIWKTNVVTDDTGRFTFTFNAFVRDEHAWLFPPFTLFPDANPVDPAVRLLVRTPGDEGQLYELIGKPALETPVRFWDREIGRFRPPATNELSEHIVVAIDHYEEPFPDNPAYTFRINRIFLDIRRGEPGPPPTEPVVTANGQQFRRAYSAREERVRRY